ncbi:hypothetical protein FRC12_001260 [Ceratobasidium sp. 428]|nr:hypothetical protein FRC12_001260 [Ceratobasidium sp. 428]
MLLTKNIKRALRFGQYFRSQGETPTPPVSPTSPTPEPASPEFPPPPNLPVPSAPPTELESNALPVSIPVASTSGSTPSPAPAVSTSAPLVEEHTTAPLSIIHFSIYQPPPQPIVEHVIPVLEECVNPKQKSGVGHTKSKLTLLTLRDLTSVLKLFRTYVAKSDITWEQASKDIALAKGHKDTHARTLHTWGRACLIDPLFTPHSTSYGQNNDPVIECDNFWEQLSLHLRGVSKYVTTTNVVQFTVLPEVQEEWGFTKPILPTTAT